MSLLCTYRAASGRRGLAFVSVPDEPGLRLLYDAGLDDQDRTEVVLVHDRLTTLAEARTVARGWAAEHAMPGTRVQTPGAGDPPGDQRSAEPRELARYQAPAGPLVEDLAGARA